ncbi:decaprenyl-phosphate phosphoribosyltransferase [Klebsiella sp. WP3-W18-ESBL-02]|uniref:decaprenyl-phosphate phosphoribosyltransferase n=1 Tax=Klebsiella sp. WP3-W18-ESBL-02 TaxID=2675710 RepID=UPI0015DCA3E7|nr:decaprenyl-phosphate phosphoribosyltransferase [Klebsiella sp. WP3-W18-ESBL-02]BBQ83230.1 decaprenyl-phosphate phosphoribosyltransferase [Klebsiella sp. WP3-W18-ESBL-02]
MSTKIIGLVKLIGPKQWIKNCFVLIPLIFSGGFLHIQAINSSLQAFFLFCIASSAVYILNDLNDIEKDRLHPIKSKKRPLAAGDVSKSGAIILLVIIYMCLIANAFINLHVFYVIFSYIILNVFYSYYLKHQPVIDIFCISIGFVLRVYAGAVALNVPLSSWMFVTTLCLALYLASIKRRQELSQAGSESRNVLDKYSISLIDKYAEMSATGTVIFYSLFVMSAKEELVISIPLVLFGLYRYWYVVEQLEGGESPTDVLYEDKLLLVTVFIWLILSLYVLYPH